ncbi:BaeS Signal transduction histidine kinase [Candidatus Nanopelagicaceae bacterium]
MKLSQTSRVSFFTVLLLTFFTVGIGGITVKHSLDVEVQKVDQSLGFVALSAYENPGQAVGAALFAIEQSNLDATLTLLARDGSETLINESTLQYPGAPALTEVEKAVRSAVRVSAETPFRIRTVPLEGGDFIIIALSTSEIDANFISDLQYLALVTLILNSFAAGLLFLYFRRERRTADSASLARMQEFLGDASHELRTPLTVIKGYVEMLSKDQLTAPADKSRAFNRVGSEITRMETLIQDLLLLAELGESGARDIETIDLSEIVTAHGTDFTTLNPDRTVGLQVTPALFIVGSRDYISRFIQNALTNIVRHTGADDAVRITLAKSGKQIELKIEDSGPGLPDSAYREDIRSLNRFDKSRSRENGGSGLGMSIMSAVIEKLDGKFSLRKSELGGLAIVAQLPIA